MAKTIRPIKPAEQRWTQTTLKNATRWTPGPIRQIVPAEQPWTRWTPGPIRPIKPATQQWSYCGSYRQAR